MASLQATIYPVMRLPKSQCAAPLAERRILISVFQAGFAKVLMMKFSGVKVAQTGPGNHRSVSSSSWTVEVSCPILALYVRVRSRLTPMATDSSRDVNLSPCDNGSWCFGSGYDGRECCQKGQGLFIAEGKATRINPKTTTSQPRLNTSVADSSTTVPTNQSISTAAKAGIGVGVGLAVTAIILVAVFLVLRKRRKDSEARRIEEEKDMSFQQDSQYDESLAPPSTEIYSTGDFHAESVELDSRSLDTANRLSYLSYRAPGLQDGPAELSTISENPTYQNPRLT